MSVGSRSMERKLHEGRIRSDHHIRSVSLGTTVLSGHRSNDHIVLVVFVTSAQVGSLGVETELSASVVSGALVDVDTFLGALGVWSEAVAAVAVESVTDVGADVFAATVVAERFAGGLATVFSASNLIRSISTIVLPITRQRSIHTLSIGTLELIRCTISVLREAGAHGKMLI